MTTIEQIIKDARTALETIELASQRKGGEQVINHSFDWLEVIVAKGREVMNVKAMASADEKTTPKETTL